MIRSHNGPLETFILFRLNTITTCSVRHIEISSVGAARAFFEAPARGRTPKADKKQAPRKPSTQ